MEDFLGLLEEFSTEVLNLNAVCGIVAGIIVLILEIKWLRNHKKKDRRKEAALSKGHVIEAKRFHFWDDETYDNISSAKFHAKYKYEFSGKTYVYRYAGKVYPPPEIVVYYKNNPRRVWSDLEKKESPLLFLLYLIPLAVTVAVINIMGGV